MEVRGPPDYATWLECYNVYICTLIMLDVSIPPRLEAHAKKMERLHILYGK